MALGKVPISKHQKHAHNRGMETIKTLRAIKVTDWMQRVPTGYILHTGWCILNTENGMLVSINGVSPYMPNGGKSAVDAVVKSGVFPEALYVQKSSEVKK